MKQMSDKELVERNGIDDAIRILTDRIYSYGCLSYEQASEHARARVAAALMKK